MAVSQTLALTGATVNNSYSAPAGVGFITVYNRAGTDECFITTNGVDPTVAGANTYYLPKVIGASVRIPVPSGGGVIKFISTAAQSIWITA